MDETTTHALYARFLHGLAVAPDRPAVRIGTEEISYTDLHERALLLAGALVRVGATRVGVLSAKTPVAYQGILAALYAGAAVVPLRPDFPAPRIREIVDASGITAVVADDKGRAVLPAVTEDRTDLTVITPDLPGNAGFSLPRNVLDPRHALTEPAKVRPDDPAYILFTSGSTGKPKGVVLTNANLASYFALHDARYDCTAADVFSQASDLNFDSTMFDLFACWGVGATLAPVPMSAYRDLPGFVAAQGVTVWFSTPSAIDLVRRMGGLTPGSLASLRWSVFGGEGLQCADAAAWQAAAPHGTVVNVYGPTEATINLTEHFWSGERSPGTAINGVAALGALHPGHDYLLLDEDGTPCADEGELWVTGPQVTPGYLDPAMDEGRFMQRDGRRWYRVGDRVRLLPDGEFGYLGRRDFQVQVQGLRVELSEIEHALRSCGVADAVVVGVKRGASTDLVAYYTGDPVPVPDLVRRLRDVLPDQILPKKYLHLPEFPLNTNRKIDRLALTQMAAR